MSTRLERRTLESFVNWAGTVTATPRRFLRPSSEAEVSAIVRDAYERGGTVRVVGAGHSWSDVAACDDTMINLDAMQRVIDVDYARRRVTVEAGIRLQHLIAELDVRGLALNNLGSVCEQSLAGAISTGTHGTGLHFGALPTQMTAFRLVNGQGAVMEVDREQTPDLFHAASVSFGALGIITQITLQAELAYDLEERAWALPFEQALREVDDLVRNHPRVKLWWLPHTGKVQVYTYDVTTTARRPATDWERRVDHFMNERVFGAMLDMGRRFPGAVPWLNRLAGLSYLKPYERVDRYDRCLTLAMPPPHLEIEYGVSIEHTADMMERIHRLVHDEHLSVGFINEVRFVRSDDNWLSGSYHRDSCQFGAYTSDGRDAGRFLEAVEDIAWELGGRPHWGKDFHADPRYLRSVFPRLDEFAALREALDPRGVFVNPFVARVLDLS